MHGAFSHWLRDDLAKLSRCLGISKPSLILRLVSLKNSKNEGRRENKYKVKDITLADWGRKEILLAEAEMPGFTALREEFSNSMPLQGAHIARCLHRTIQLLF
jgi:hypothetical protein